MSALTLTQHMQELLKSVNITDKWELLNNIKVDYDNEHCIALQKAGYLEFIVQDVGLWILDVYRFTDLGIKFAILVML